MGTNSDRIRTGGTSFSNIASYIVGRFILISVCWSSIDGRLVTCPESRVAILGETIQFGCSTDMVFSINWQHTPFRSGSVPVDVYISRVIVSLYHERFSVETKDLGGNVTEYNLIISNVQKEDAGTFICIDYSGLGEKKEAQLTVIESHPRCSSNIEPSGFIGENDCGHPIETVSCSCSVDYFGNIAPTSQWVTSAGHMIPTAPISNMTTSSVSSVITMFASISIDGVQLSWQLVESKNVNWISNPIKILYAKKNVSTVVVEHDEIVTCSAISSENCTYSWTAIIKPNYKTEILKGRVLRVKEPGTYRCEAVCPLRQMFCSVTSLHVEYTAGDGVKYWIAILVVLIVVLIISVLVMLIKITRNRNRQKQLLDQPYKTALQLHANIENNSRPNSTSQEIGKLVNNHPI